MAEVVYLLLVVAFFFGYTLSFAMQHDRVMTIMRENMRLQQILDNLLKRDEKDDDLGI